jgi:O-antigen ligase
MSGRAQRFFWPFALWLALLAGICVAWSPRYWAVEVGITAIGAVAIGWAVSSFFQPGGGRGFELPWQAAPVALMGLWGFGQIALGITVMPQLTHYSAIVWAIGAVAFLLGTQILADRGARVLFLELTMWSMTVLAVAAMVQFYNHADVFGLFAAPETVVGTFISRNQFAAMMEIAGPVALWYMLERSFLRGGLCYVMIAAAVLTAASRMGFIITCGELAVFIGIVLVQKRRQGRAIAVTLIGLALLVAIAATISDTETLRKRFQDSDPYIERRELLASTLRLIEEKPWTGFGMGTWQAIYPHVATFDAALLANEAHNDWAQWAAEGGLGFPVLMAIVVLSIAPYAIRSVWGMGVLGVMVHSYVDFPLREPVLSFLWFAIAGAAVAGAGNALHKRRDRRGESAAVSEIAVA